MAVSGTLVNGWNCVSLVRYETYLSIMSS